MTGLVGVGVRGLEGIDRDLGDGYSSRVACDLTNAEWRWLGDRFVESDGKRRNLPLI